MKTLFLSLSIIIFAAICVHAQDDTISDASQFVTILDQGLTYPLVDVEESTTFNPTLNTFWADFDQLTNAIGNVRSLEGQTRDDIVMYPLLTLV